MNHYDVWLLSIPLWIIAAEASKINKSANTLLYYGAATGSLVNAIIITFMKG